jgi:hypothetical protein
MSANMGWLRHVLTVLSVIIFVSDIFTFNQMYPANVSTHTQEKQARLVWVWLVWVWLVWVWLVWVWLVWVWLDWIWFV